MCVLMFDFFLFVCAVYRGWSWGRKGLSMEGDGAKGLACQKTLDGKASNGNKAVPSCCLKAMSCLPEEDAKCHSTVVSGWFSEHSRSGTFFFLLVKLLYLFRTFVLFLLFFCS